MFRLLYKKRESSVFLILKNYEGFRKKKNKNTTQQVGSASVAVLILVLEPEYAYSGASATGFVLCKSTGRGKATHHEGTVWMAST